MSLSVADRLRIAIHQYGARRTESNLAEVRVAAEALIELAGKLDAGIEWRDSRIRDLEYTLMKIAKEAEEECGAGHHGGSTAADSGFRGSDAGEKRRTQGRASAAESQAHYPPCPQCGEQSRLIKNAPPEMGGNFLCAGCDLFFCEPGGESSGDKKANT